MVGIRIHSIALLALVALSVAACAPKSDLDAANAKLAEATANLTAANKTMADLRAQLSAAQRQISDQTAQLDILPPLPVSHSVRTSLLGSGLVVVFGNTAKKPMTVRVVVKKPALGNINVKGFELHLNPAVPCELGYAQGAVFEPGNIITLTSTNYATETFTIDSASRQSALEPPCVAQSM